MKPIFVLCEGPHDTAFLGRLLKAAGVQPYNETVENYQPKVLSKFLINRYQLRDAEGARHRSKGQFILDNPPVLESAYRIPNPDRLLLFHRCGGDKQYEAIRGFLDDIVELSRPGAANVGLSSFGLIFVRDADDIGIEARVEELRSQFAEVLRPVLPDFRNLSANVPDEIVRNGDFAAGCCIFAEPGQNTGTLEAILWPLLNASIPIRLAEAHQYVDKHGVDGTEVARGINRAVKRRKAAINISGQIDAPGFALSVSLRDTPTFDDVQIGSDITCRTLTRMISEI